MLGACASTKHEKNPENSSLTGLLGVEHEDGECIPFLSGVSLGKDF